MLRRRPTNFYDFTLAHDWARVDVATGEVLDEGTLDTPIQSAAVSPDARRLAVGGDEVVIVDLRTAEASAASEQLSTGAQYDLRWAPDGSAVVSTGDDDRVYLWDGRTGEPLGDVVHAGGAASPAFLADSRTVRLAAWDGAVYDWDTSLEHAVEVACRISGGGLSREAWSSLLPEQDYQETCD
jgi:WD40 repeat protein